MLKMIHVCFKAFLKKDEMRKERRELLYVCFFRQKPFKLQWPLNLIQ